MYLADLKPGGQAPPTPHPSVQRFVLVIEGKAQVLSPEGKETINLPVNHYVYFPPNSTTAATLEAPEGAVLLVYEKVYAAKVGLHGYHIVCFTVPHVRYNTIAIPVHCTVALQRACRPGTLATCEPVQSTQVSHCTADVDS
jgi:hypothetical protein